MFFKLLSQTLNYTGLKGIEQWQLRASETITIYILKHECTWVFSKSGYWYVEWRLV